MANQICNIFKTMLWKGQIKTGSGVGYHTFRMILMEAGFVYDKDTHQDYDSVVGKELPTANGYTTGGIALSNIQVVTDYVSDRCKVTANNVQWNASGGSIVTSGAIIFDDSTSIAAGDDVTKVIISWIDGGGTQTIVDGASLTISNILLTAEDIA